MIHALVGENGAEKSTLEVGVTSPACCGRMPSSVEVSGQPARFRSPLDAVAAGIGVVHQHFLLADALTVTPKNVALGLGTECNGPGASNRRKAEAAVAARLAHQTGLAIDPAARIAELPVGLRQRVRKIIKAALPPAHASCCSTKPTAVLACRREVADSVRYAAKPAAPPAASIVVAVTHKLDEVFALASAVTVLRRGETTFAGPP